MNNTLTQSFLVRVLELDSVRQAKFLDAADGMSNDVADLERLLERYETEALMSRLRDGKPS